MERDWKEDFPDDNGNYQHACVLCTELFNGNKYRLVCKRCATLNGWIPIEDRKPPSGECVLLYGPKSGVVEGAWLESKNHFEQWRWSCVTEPTHWRNLPEPPKNQNPEDNG